MVSWSAGGRDRHKKNKGVDKMVNEKEETIKELKDLVKRADYKAYTILRSVSRSGMFRRISVLLIIDNEPYFIDHLINKLGTYKRDKKEEGLRVSGCGMDMGFDVVYNAGRDIWATKEEAQAEKIITYRNGNKEPETDGGYLIKQRWL